jgi:hypothetical protein
MDIYFSCFGRRITKCSLNIIFIYIHFTKLSGVGILHKNKGVDTAQIDFSEFREIFPLLRSLNEFAFNQMEINHKSVGKLLQDEDICGLKNKAPDRVVVS